MTIEALLDETRLFPLRDTYLFSPTGLAPPGSAGLGPLGGNWTAPNPPFGAVFTYNVGRGLPAEARLVVTITDESGRQVRRLAVDRSEGLRRIAWNLRVDPVTPGGRGGAPGGFATPGRYRATLATVMGDTVSPVGPATTFGIVQVEQ
jgi:hypothetical protein